MLSRLRACLLSLLLLEPASAWRLSAALAGSAFAVEALAQTRSSGGYSRPGSGGGRTPSFGGPRVAPRTPSTSGGYARPTPSAPGYQRRPSVEAPSGGGSAP